MNISNFFYDLYSWFSSISSGVPINDEALIHFFEPDFTMHVNGKCVVNDRRGLKPHFKAILNNPGEIQLILPFQNLIIEKPKVALSYQIEHRHNNQTTSILVMGIYTLSKNNKAQSKWELNYRENNNENV